LKNKGYNNNSLTEELKENIYREIANIPAGQLQRVNLKSCSGARNVCM
jgi:hypothetical protein